MPLININHFEFKKFCFFQCNLEPLLKTKLTVRPINDAATRDQTETDYGFRLVSRKIWKIKQRSLQIFADQLTLFQRWQIMITTDFDQYYLLTTTIRIFRPSIGPTKARSVNFEMSFLRELKTPKRHFEINWPLRH